MAIFGTLKWEFMAVFNNVRAILTFFIWSPCYRKFVVLYLLLLIDLPLCYLFTPKVFTPTPTLYKKVAQSKYGLVPSFPKFWNSVPSLIECAARCNTVIGWGCDGFMYDASTLICIPYYIWKVSDQELYQGDVTQIMHIQQGIEKSNYYLNYIYFDKYRTYALHLCVVNLVSMSLYVRTYF